MPDRSALTTIFREVALTILRLHSLRVLGSPGGERATPPSSLSNLLSSVSVRNLFRFRGMEWAALSRFGMG